MNVLFVDKNGTTGVVQNDFSVSADGPVSEKVRLFLKGEEHTHEEDPPTVAALPSRFLIDLFCQTSVARVEPVSLTCGTDLPK